MASGQSNRCPARHRLFREGEEMAIQCQGIMDHERAHWFQEDHYTLPLETDGSQFRRSQRLIRSSGGLLCP